MHTGNVAGMGEIILGKSCAIPLSTKGENHLKNSEISYFGKSASTTCLK